MCEDSNEKSTMDIVQMHLGMTDIDLERNL